MRRTEFYVGVLEGGKRRTGVGTLSVFGYQMR